MSNRMNNPVVVYKKPASNPIWGVVRLMLAIAVLVLLGVSLLADPEVGDNRIAMIHLLLFILVVDRMLEHLCNFWR